MSNSPGEFGRPDQARGIPRLHAARTELLIVASLTGLAFVLRLAGLNQSLFGDELYTYAEVHGGLSHLFDGLANWEIAPPLYFLLAWASRHLGDPTTLIRLPSLVFATATVPVTYAIGVRTVGRRAALMAAALVTLSPFATFYGNEARPYGQLALLSGASTLLLLVALDRGSIRWWVLFAVCSCLVLYTHYTGVFVVLALFAWAACYHRDQLRRLLLAGVLVVLGYLPWLPSFFTQRSSGNVEGLGRAVGPLTPHSIGQNALRAFPGHPLVPLRDLPGRPAVALVGFVLLATLVYFGVRLAREGAREGLHAPSPEIVLVALTAAATPIGLLLFSLGGNNIFGSRNLIASLPGAALLIGLAVTSLPRVPRALAAVAVLGVLGLGAVESLEDTNRRAPLREAAHYISSHGHPGDGVVLVRFRAPSDPLSHDADIQLPRSYRVFYSGENDSGAWKLAAGGRRLFFMRPPSGYFAGAPRPPADLAARVRLIGSRSFQGLGDIVVFEYGRGAN